MALPAAREVTQDNLVEVVKELHRILSGEVELGHPQDPRDPNSTTLATGTAATHNGTKSNVDWSWVEANVEATDTPVNFVHNLNVPVIQVAAVNQPNVRWCVWGFRHNGTGTIVTSAPIGLVHEHPTDAALITANSFPLRLYGGDLGLGRTINAANPVRATVAFIRAIR